MESLTTTNSYSSNIPHLFYKKLRSFTTIVLSITLTFNPFFIQVAHATVPATQSVAHIVPDGTTETTTDRAQNGTPVVNIARPGSGGVSHNTFRDYNVLNDNVILNNFKGEVGVSQLGGALYGNPNFNKDRGQTASIILNEITSNRITRLDGYTEVFGDRASVIIANPNGIQTSGAGFINTSRMSLISGKPNLNPDSGAIEDFDINPNAQIVINARNVSGKDANGNDIVIPLGLDAGTTNYSEIISRTVTISGEIYGGTDFNIKTGNNKYNYDTKEITSNDENQESKPEISIDGSAFGAMYAGRISFTSTEGGVGVRIAGGDLVATVDNINISAAGNIEFDKLVAQNDISVDSSAGNITQNESSYAENDVNFMASDSINVNGDYLHGTNEVTFATQNGDINNNSHIEGGSVALTAHNDVNNINSTIFGIDSVRVTSIAGDINNVSTDEDDSNISSIQSRGDLHLEANNGNINNNKSILKALRDMTLVANTISNQNTISSTGNLRGISAGNDLTIVANELLNQSGYIKASGKFDITLNESRLNNDGGLIYSSFYTDSEDENDHKTSKITFNNLTNETNDSNNIGIILVGDYLLLNGDGDSNLTNDGTIQTGNKLTIETNDFVNNGELKSFRDIAINIAGDFLNNKTDDVSGKITALNSIKILNANNFTNKSDIIVMDENVITENSNNKLFTANVRNDFINSGRIVVDGDFRIEGTNNFINNGGQVDVGDDIYITADNSIQNINNSSLIAKNNIELYSQNSITNISSDIYSFLGDINLAKNIDDDPDTPEIELEKNESILNLGGRIEALAGKVNIATKDLINQNLLVNEDGTINYSDLVEDESETSYRFINAWTDGNAYLHQGGLHWGLRFDRGIYQDGYAFVIGQMIYGAGVYRKETKRRAKSSVRNYEATIKSGSDMRIEADKITNHLSIIHSKGGMKLIGDAANPDSSLNNRSYAIENTVTYKCSSNEVCAGYDSSDGAFYDGLGIYWGHLLGEDVALRNGDTIDINKVSGHLTSSIISDGEFSATGFGGDIAQESVRGNLDGILSQTTEENPSSEISSLKENGFVNVTDGLDLPEGENGLFKVNKTDEGNGDISREYLVENNSKFKDTSLFLGSDYFLKRIGFNPNTDVNVQRLGDAAYEQKLIMDAINRVSNFKYLQDDIKSDNEQIQRLYDNAYLEYSDSDLEVGKELTKEQIDNLKKDIIWLVEKEIDGRKVLATEIYFAKSTIEALANKNNTTGANIKGKTVDIKSGGDIKNSFGSITATDGGITLISQGSVDLVNSNLNSSGATLIAANDDVNIVSGYSHQGFTLPFATTEILDKSKPNNKSMAASFSASSVEFVDTPAIVYEAVNARSSITFNAGSDIQIVSGSDVNIRNNHFNSGGSIFVDAGNDVNNSNYTIKASENVVITAANDINNIHTTDSSNETRIEAGKMASLDAGNDINNKGATIKAGEILYLTAGNNINNEALITTKVNHVEVSNEVAENSNSDHIRSTLESRGSLISDGNLIMIAGNDVNNSASDIATTGLNTNFTGGVYIEATAGDINITTDTLRNRTASRWGSKKRGGSSITDETNNVGSTLNVAGNLTITSKNDTNITGSDVVVGGDATINTGGDLNILAAQDTSYSYEESHKKGSFGRRSSSSSTKSSTTNIESNIIVGGDITSNSEENINILASNLSSEGNISLVAGEKINIAAGQDTNYSKTTSNKKGVTITSSSTQVAYDLTNVYSDLNAAGDITLTSGTDTNLVGANLGAGSNININAGDELMVAAVADESYRYSNSTKTKSMATIAKYTGVSAALKTAEIVTDALAFATKPLSEVGLNPASSIASGLVNYAQNLTEGDLSSKMNTNVTQTKTYQLAELNAGGNLNVTASNNANLIGVDIDAVDTVIASTNGDVNIANVKDSSYSKSTIQKSNTTLTSLATDAVKNGMLALSTMATSRNMLQHPDAKKQTIEENEEAMGQVSKKQFTQINSVTDETVISSTIDVNSLTINSGRDTLLTSTDIDSTGEVDINSGNDTTIASDLENDSSFTLTEKKNPNIVAALSNGIVKVIGDAMPDFSFKKPDDKEQDPKKKREDDSLNHNPHNQDIGVATNTDDAFVNGYTISNNDADELAYDTDLDKKTVETKTYVASNIVSGGDINIDSDQGDNTIIASNLTAEGDINITAENGETLITSAVNESFVATSHVEQEYNDISTNYDRGRVSVDARTSIYEKDSKNWTTTQASSNLVSGGSINVNTNGDINILSSNLSSNNEINLDSAQGNTNIGANKNTQRSEEEIREGTLTLSAGVGHVAVDAAYAMDDTVKAAEGLKKAKENLSRMKRLRKEGKASKDAVDDAETNLAVSYLNVSLANLKLLSAAEKVNTTAITLGFYGDLKLTRTGDKTNTTNDSSQEVASNLIAVNNVNIDSGSGLVGDPSGEDGNTNIKGNVQSVNSDINITSFNDTNITALTSEASSATKSEGFTQTVTLGGSYGKSVTDELITSITAQISKRSGKSDSSNVNYTNSNVVANNGAININSTNNDTNIIGANVAANSIAINSGGDLNVESLQNSSRSKSKSKSIGAGGGSGSGSLSYSSNRSSFERNWVDDQTSIIAENGLTVNTTGNTDVKGAVIASDNGDLTINTATLTYSDIFDREKQESSGFGFSTNISLGSEARNPAAKNPGQDKNYYPAGSTSLSLSNSGYEKEQITRATIGSGVINITSGGDGGNIANGAVQTQDLANLNRDMDLAQEITKDTITGALDASMTVDNRIIGVAFGSDGARRSLSKSVIVGMEKILNGDVLKANAILIDEAVELLGETPVIGKVTRQVTSPVEGVIDYFYENETKLYATVDGKVRELTREETLVFEKYAVNGIMTPKEKMIANYLNPKENNIVVRHNPTSGFLGDLVESGLGKTLGWVAPDSSKMVREVRKDLYARRGLGNEGGSVERYNIFHSQGSIIGEGAMRSYINNYGNEGNNKINDSQVFVAVGPAVSERKWGNTVTKLAGKSQERIFEHDSNDPVRYTASPSITSLLIGDIARGIYHGKDMDKHDVRGNYDYAHYLMSKSYIDKHNLPTPEDRRAGDLTDPRTKIKSHPFYTPNQNKNNTQ